MRKFQFKSFIMFPLVFLMALSLKAQTSRNPEESHKRLGILNTILKDESHLWFKHKNYNKQFQKEVEKLHARTMRKALEEERRHLELLRSEGADANNMKYEKKMFQYQGNAEQHLDKFEKELAKEHPKSKKVQTHGLKINRNAEKMSRTHNLWLDNQKIKPPE